MRMRMRRKTKMATFVTIQEHPSTRQGIHSELANSMEASKVSQRPHRPRGDFFHVRSYSTPQSVEAS